MKIQKSFSDRLLTTIAYLFMGLFAVICLYPLILTLSVSLSSEKNVAIHGYSILPQGFSLNTYIYIFAHSGKKILRSYGITIFVTAVGTLGALLITTMISFAISVKTLKYRNVIAFLCNFTIIFSAGLIPWYIVCINYYHLRNSILALILPSIFSVWNMFLLRTYFSYIPPSLYEAAKIDGANYFKIYYKIALPLCKTGILTVGLMYALQYWNDWWNSLMFINDKKLFPLQYYLYNILSNVNAISSGLVPSGAAANIALPAETVKMAVTIITIGPIIFLYPFVQKFFINGIMTGAVKE
ncbi:carbohydrate ABC transporter permease [Anaerocolumna xylanovorans]|uniref:Putative aldouronate transport system permease protein n=1 Tax=Anaerocolumna xylanovorans DSM 12503 TaxID=1121345 RepID=A0A1M7YJ82_9FIRM|nr:carbohydrate ABC transporter permease [Anaerocolumna xylanovorans]SHO52677.1 putative aldouronate transport system permease protein [Anaerocolumna xylanovorans DSM 12503]